MISIVQLMRLRDILDQQFLQDEIRFVNRLLQLTIQEYQRDTDTLPLDLWKKAVSIINVSFFIIIFYLVYERHYWCS